MSESIYWYARIPGVDNFWGPYGSQVEAWKSVMSTEGVPMVGAVVWPTDRELDLDDIAERIASVRAAMAMVEARKHLSRTEMIDFLRSGGER